MKELNRGDIIYVDLGQHIHSCVQSGVRPCVVIGTYPSSPVANVCPMTSRMDKKGKPVHVKVNKKFTKSYLFFMIYVIIYMKTGSFFYCVGGATWENH